MHHAHVEAGALGETRCLGICGDDARDLLLGERLNGDTVGTHAVARPELVQVAFFLLVDHVCARILTRVRQLDRGECAMALDGVGDIGEGAELTGRLEREVKHLGSVGLGMHDELAHRNDGGAALRARLVEAERARTRRALSVDVGCAERRRAHAVTQRQTTDLERLAEIRIIAFHDGAPPLHIPLQNKDEAPASRLRPVIILQC